MGVRTDVRLHYSNGQTINIYSHWYDVDTLKYVVKGVLKRKERWDDESYLARMIFSAIIKDDIDSATGYGLAPYDMGDRGFDIYLPEQKVDDIPFDMFIEL